MCVPQDEIRVWVPLAEGDAERRGRGHRSELSRTSAEICGMLMRGAEEILVARLHLHSSASQSGYRLAVLALMQTPRRLPPYPNVVPSLASREPARPSAPHGSYSCIRATIVIAPVLETSHNSTINDD